MIRQIHRRWQRLLTRRARAALLLFVWTASVVLTVIHDDDGAVRAGHGDARSTVAAVCGSSGPCHDPTHHHAPLVHHDVTQCPYCAMLLERPAGLPDFSFAPQTAVRLVAATPALRLSSSQRCACAQARGPPSVAAPV